MSELVGWSASQSVENSTKYIVATFWNGRIDLKKYLLYLTNFNKQSKSKILFGFWVINYSLETPNRHDPYIQYYRTI